MNKESYAFFQLNGYLDLGRVLTDGEVERFTAIFDRDRRHKSYAWHPIGQHQTINCDALVTSPQFDDLVRCPRVLTPIQELMGGPVCFSEICIRHMATYDGELSQAWHRDRPHWKEHSLRMDYLQLMLYLTEVDPTTHCFSISPESVHAPMAADNEAQLAEGGSLDCHGPAGSAFLFNVSVLHTATVLPTRRERKTVQVYYGHRKRPYLSDDSLVPPRFWRDHSDPKVRAFYGNLNDKTRTYTAALSQPSPGAPTSESGRER